MSLNLFLFFERCCSGVKCRGAAYFASTLLLLTAERLYSTSLTGYHGQICTSETNPDHRQQLQPVVKRNNHYSIHVLNMSASQSIDTADTTPATDPKHLNSLSSNSAALAITTIIFVAVLILASCVIGLYLRRRRRAESEVTIVDSDISVDLLLSNGRQIVYHLDDGRRRSASVSSLDGLLKTGETPLEIDVEHLETVAERRGRQPLGLLRW